MKQKIQAIVVVLAITLPLIGGFYVVKSFSNFADENQRSAQSVDAHKRSAPTASELLKLTNDERTKAGLKPLELSSSLNTSAQLKADDMSNNHYYGHENPKTGKKGATYVFDIAPGMCSNASENLVGALDSKTAVEEWMKSQKHKDAILDTRFTLVGFGIHDDLIVQHFCQPAN